MRSGTRDAIRAVVFAYIGLAIYTRARESMGAYSCGCDADCWCRRPGLSLFRWVFPRRHRNAALESWKSQRFEDQD
jgi:hypothetical protein